jgi:hypothetical protein
MTRINDMTDAIDTRLQAMQRDRAPRAEEDAAITVYERVRTARSICEALLPGSYSDASVVALAGELGRLVQSGHVLDRR